MSEKIMLLKDAIPLGSLGRRGKGRGRRFRGLGDIGQIIPSLSEAQDALTFGGSAALGILVTNQLVNAINKPDAAGKQPFGKQAVVYVKVATGMLLGGIVASVLKQRRIGFAIQAGSIVIPAAVWLSGLLGKQSVPLTGGYQRQIGYPGAENYPNLVMQVPESIAAQAGLAGNRGRFQGLGFPAAEAYNPGFMGSIY